MTYFQVINYLKKINKSIARSPLPSLGKNNVFTWWLARPNPEDVTAVDVKKKSPTNDLLDTLGVALTEAGS